MTATQDPTIKRRQLRIELKRARVAAGLKQADVAAAMDWSLSKIIRIERGDVSISTNDLTALLNYYGLKDKSRISGLLELARSARGVSIYEYYADVLKPGFKEYLAYEASAAHIRQYDPILIPGLLQTEEYGREILEHMAGFDPAAVEKAWVVREHRQEVLDRESPPEMTYLLDEAALRRHIGRGHVMPHQLQRIQVLAAQPYIDIRIIPFTGGAHPGMAGQFIILEFADPNLYDLVYLESINEITIRDDTDLLARYLDRFEQLQGLALSPKESVDFLDVLVKDMSLTDQAANYAEKEVV